MFSAFRKPLLLAVEQKIAEPECRGDSSAAATISSVWFGGTTRPGALEEDDREP